MCVSFVKAKETGKKRNFPYKDVMTGKVLVTGLPAEILPLKPMSYYGHDKLMRILDTKSITVTE